MPIQNVVALLLLNFLAKQELQRALISAGRHLPEPVLGPEVLDAVAVHEPPVPRRPVRVVAHHVQVQSCKQIKLSC